MTNAKPAKRLLALLCAVMVLFTVMVSPAHAETAAERYARLQQELKQTRSQIAKYKNDINAKKLLREQYEQEKAIIDEMIVLNQEEIDKTQTDLDQKQAQIAVKRQSIYESDQLLQRRLIAIYNMNHASALSQILNVDSFSEMYTAMDAIRRISLNDSQLLQELSEQKAKMEEEQFEIDSLLGNLNSYHQELLLLQDELVQNIMALDSSITLAEAQLKAQQQIEGDQYADLVAAQKEMQRIAGSIGGSSKGDGSEFVGGRFTWPVPSSYRITCEFGAPDPNGTPHRGMDIGAPAGTSIVACGNGTVIIATSASSYGNYLVIDHGNGIKTLYAHCTSLDVGAGTVVSTGQHIATVGSTGFSTGNHLHLEVQDGGILQNPRNWLSG